MTAARATCAVLALLSPLLCLSTGCVAVSARERSHIVRTLHRQDEAWNRGDIDAFMTYYWKSNDLTFSSGGKTTRGWEDTLANYKKRYPTPERMGRLSFTDLEVRWLSSRIALVLGRWHLDREKEPVGGNFSLVMHKIGGEWMIVHDHTSVDKDEEPGAARTEPSTP